MQIRKTTLDDMDLLIKLRMDFLFEDDKAQSWHDLENIKIKLREYFGKWIPNDGFVAFIAEEANEVYSTAFLSIVERPPRKADSSYLVGTVYNVFTYPEYRKKGIATKVMSALLEEAKLLNVAYIDLLATDAGKPLYEKIGFEQILNYTSMRFKI
ncbi:MAG: GNAT family N-acetyltransferase [Oscillospiraceae bacterium]|nr:GNAT family N-acetyltransferase [Oscillospiraceae bacterium]